MNRKLQILLSVMTFALFACDAGRHEPPLVTGQDDRDPVSIQVIVLNAAQLPDGGKWNDLLGRPLIALEYQTQREIGTGGRVLYLYDGRTGECRTVIHAPGGPGDPMLIGWAPCK